MYKVMDWQGLMNYGTDAIYGLNNPQNKEVIIVSDLRRYNYGEYTVERGNIFGLKIVWSNISKKKCIEKAKQMAMSEV